MLVGVPSALVKDRIEGRWMGLILESLEELGRTGTTVEFEVRPAARHEDAAPPDVYPATNGGPQEADLAADRSRSTARPSIGLNPSFTFDSFVIGQSNSFPHAAARAVAENPARAYNPLFIHGGSGLGKTHLLHAIGNYIRENSPSLHVRYVTTETFMNDFVNAIRTNSTISFKREFRQSDVLLVDDIHFIENKEGLQEEFFHTFNDLTGARKQIVITSDRPPRISQRSKIGYEADFLQGCSLTFKFPTWSRVWRSSVRKTLAGRPASRTTYSSSSLHI